MAETTVDVEVWSAEPGLAHPGHERLLTAAERSRRAEFRRAEDRSRFAMGTVLTKLAVAVRLDREPAEVVVERTCVRCGRPHGRPRLPGGELAVSISHSGDRVLVAITHGAPIGVDVERVSDDRDTLALARRVLAPGESVLSRQDFFRYWVRKEAILKATGDGLAMPMAEVEVTAPDQPPRLVRYGQIGIDARLADLSVGDGYEAAVAVLTSRPLVVSVVDGARLLG